MSDRDKQWRKMIFRDSRKLISADRLGFFLKTLVFVIAMISIDIISIFINYKMNFIIGIAIGIILWAIIDVMFSKFLLNSNELGMSAPINDSNIHMSAYIQCTIWNGITMILKFLPSIAILNTALLAMGLLFEGWRINFTALFKQIGINLITVIGIGLIISLFFFSVNYLIIEGKEKNFINAIIRSITLTLTNFKSTIIVVIVVNVQVYVLGILAFWGLISNNFGIVTLIAFIFVITALISYYNIVLIKWYRYINAKYEKSKKE